MFSHIQSFVIIHDTCMYVSNYVVNKIEQCKLMEATFLKSYILRDFWGNANYLDD